MLSWFPIFFPLMVSTRPSEFARRPPSVLTLGFAGPDLPSGQLGTRRANLAHDRWRETQSLVRVVRIGVPVRFGRRVPRAVSSESATATTASRVSARFIALGCVPEQAATFVGRDVVASCVGLCSTRGRQRRARLERFCFGRQQVAWDGGRRVPVRSVAHDWWARDLWRSRQARQCRDEPGPPFDTGRAEDPDLDDQVAQPWWKGQFCRAVELECEYRLDSSHYTRERAPRGSESKEQ